MLPRERSAMLRASRVARLARNMPVFAANRAMQSANITDGAVQRACGSALVDGCNRALGSLGCATHRMPRYLTAGVSYNWASNHDNITQTSARLYEASLGQSLGQPWSANKLEPLKLRLNRSNFEISHAPLHRHRWCIVSPASSYRVLAICFALR